MRRKQRSAEPDDYLVRIELRSVTNGIETAVYGFTMRAPEKKYVHGACLEAGQKLASLIVEKAL